MAFTYNEALTTDRDKVRFHIADTREESAAFSDAEIDALVTLAGSVYGAAALACDNMASAIAQGAQSYTDGTPDGRSRTLDTTARIEALRARAAHFRNLAGGSILPSITVRTLKEPPGSIGRNT